MKNIIKLTVVTLALTLTGIGRVNSQPQDEFEYGAGLIFEDDLTDKVPKRAVLLTRSYDNLPASYSLKKYAPSVLSQGRYGTCVGWSTAYAARTILEAYANGWTDRATIDREAYSPIFLYSLLESNCNVGTYISSAVRKMKEVGVVKKRDVPDVCPIPSPNMFFGKAGEHRIENYFTTFDRRDSPNVKVAAVKKALSENKPVVIGMPVYESFDRQGSRDGGVWNGHTTTASRGGHAMCVVGYDDNKAGGAFEIMNSWGTRWGDKGFVWVKYGDFGNHAQSGNDIYVRPRPQPQPKPVPGSGAPSPKPQPAIVNLAGSLQFKLRNGIEMAAALLPNSSGGLPIYRLAEKYPSGTSYRIYLSNNEPAYVYVLESDLTGSITRIFPPDNRISAALFYKSNDIALPAEDLLYQLDNTPGTTYNLVLYSQNELPIDDIKNKIRDGSGDFAQKARSAVGSAKLVPTGDITFERQSIKFSSKSEASVVAIVVEIDHK